MRSSHQLSEKVKQWKKLVWVFFLNKIIVHTEEIEIIIQQIPTHILDEMEHQKNISMQNVLKNSVHTQYGKNLYA